MASRIGAVLWSMRAWHTGRIRVTSMNGARQQCTGRTVDRMDARAELMECWESLRDAMELGDVSGLEALLADEYTLTQPTGTVLTKRQWLADLDADRIRYHRI